MSIDQIFEAIRPGLTFYTVVLTFFIISFRFARYFWEYETKILDENVDRIRAIVAGFRKTQLEPILRETLLLVRHGAIEESLTGLINLLYPLEGLRNAEEINPPLVSDDKLKEIVRIDALRGRLNQLKSDDRPVLQYFGSRSGSEFFEKIDQQHKTLNDLTSRYYEARRHCTRASYSFMAVAGFLLIGLLKLVYDWPTAAITIWLLLCFAALLMGLYSFVRMEMNRRALIRSWEEQQIHGQA